jgi:hypothetical protein
LNNTNIESFSSQALGVIYDQKLSFNNNSDSIIPQAFKKFGLLKTICPKINGQTFLKLYKSYILSILEFCNLCFTPNMSQIISFEKERKKFTQYICFKLNSYDLHYKETLELLSLQSIETRTVIQILSVILNIKTRSQLIPNQWINAINFVNNDSNGT